MKIFKNKLEQVFLGVIFSALILFVLHNAFQYVAEKQVGELVEVKASEYEKALGYPMDITYSDVGVDYLCLCVTLNDVIVDIGGENLIASLSVDKYKQGLIFGESHLSGVNALSIKGSSGALSMAKVKHLEFAGDLRDKGADWSSFYIQVDGFEMAKDFYTEFFDDSVLDLVAIQMKDGALSGSISVKKSSENKLNAKISVNSVKSFDLGFDIDYATSTNTSSNLINYTVDSFSLQFLDDGIREHVFAWGGDLVREGPVVFKQKLLEGLSQYADLVLIGSVLPKPALETLISFVDLGGNYVLSVDFAEPVNTNDFFGAILGLYPKDIYEGATVKTEVN